jgi:hypothetical protein
MKEEALLGNPFIREPRVVSWPRMVVGLIAHVARAPPFYHRGEVVELKRETVEGKGGKKGHGGWLATNLWSTGHAWPPLNLYIHHPLNLVPLMLTPLTKSIKSKPNSFHLFPKFFLFIFKYFIFYIMQ